MNAMTTTTLADRIAASFRVDPITETEHAMISALLANPGALAGELALKVGWDDWSTWNLHFGTMCKRRMPLLGDAPVNDKGAPFYSDLLIDFGGSAEEGWEYWLKDGAAEALALVLIGCVMADTVKTVKAEAKRKVRKGVALTKKIETSEA
jgi:hypothetical protein